jgi:hypothetical protein
MSVIPFAVDWRELAANLDVLPAAWILPAIRRDAGKGRSRMQGRGFRLD